MWKLFYKNYIRRAFRNNENLFYFMFTYIVLYTNLITLGGGVEEVGKNRINYEYFVTVGYYTFIDL